MIFYNDIIANLKRIFNIILLIFKELIIAKTNRTVVRNEAYRRGSLNIRERHNERKNENYYNADIIQERANLNFYFKKCEGTYEQNFDKLLTSGGISTRGLKENAKIVDEFIFDVNSLYFENKGGYEYAKQFFEQAYRLAVKEVKNEDYILSAVMHADEKNQALSDELGRDIFHYHLHVVYIPVVDKEVYFNKNNKNPELAGKLKEVIHQVSHSKKWPREIQLDENGEPVRSKNGKPILINSYSLLQDRFYEHMSLAGFDGFERGERGSTAEHLDILDFKIKQEMDRISNLNEKIEDKENTADSLNKIIQHKEKQIKILDKKLSIQKQADIDITALDNFGKNKNLVGQIVVTPEEIKNIKRLAKEGAASRSEIYELKFKLNRANHDVTAVTKERDDWKSKYQSLYEKCKFFLDAIRHAPKKVMEFIKNIMRETPEQSETAHDRQHKKSREDII